MTEAERQAAEETDATKEAEGKSEAATSTYVVYLTSDSLELAEDKAEEPGGKGGKGPPPEEDPETQKEGTPDEEEHKADDDAAEGAAEEAEPEPTEEEVAAQAKVLPLEPANNAPKAT